MKSGFRADRLDVAAFAAEGATLDATDELGRYPRLAAEACVPAATLPVTWKARGEQRGGAGTTKQPWLHLDAETVLPMTCQRCLEPVDVPLAVDRWFRFVESEEAAAAQDEDAQEDVLALAADFDLRRLVEDELILALPLVPMHDQCPTAVTFTTADPQFDAAGADVADNPFSVLESLRRPKDGH